MGNLIPGMICNDFLKEENEEEKKNEDELNQKKEEKEKKAKDKESGKKKGDKEKHLELTFKIQLNEEKEEIYKVYEISDERLAVELDNSIKIYSLKNFKLITEIKHNRIDNSIELRNKDIAITQYSSVYIYKLSGNNYFNYLKLDGKEKIFEIYELKNENLVLCIRRCLMIYAKGKDEYKFLSKFKLIETVGKIIEIKNNVLFLFLHSRCDTFITADYSPYGVELINIEKKEKVMLDSGCFSRYDEINTFYGCNLIIKNDKYLYARYAKNFCIFNLGKEKLNIIYEINTKKNKEHFPLNFESLCDYDNDSFIVIPSGFIYKYDEIANKIIQKQKFNIEIANLIDIIKLKNNNFVAHNKNELFIIKNY